MVVAPNWVGLAAVGLLGLANPGFWVLGAGLELGYLLAAFHQRAFPAYCCGGAADLGPRRQLDARVSARRSWRSASAERRRYQAIADRCQSIIDLQVRHSTTGLVGLEAQQEGLARLSWMYLRLMLARQAIVQRPRRGRRGRASCRPRYRALEGRLAGERLNDELRRSLEGQVEILRQRIERRAEAERS